MNINEKSTLKEIINALGLRDRPYLINPFTELNIEQIPEGKEKDKAHEFLKGRNFDELSLSELLYICPAWNLSSIISGLNALLKLSERENFIHNIWLEKEDGKDKTGLFSFPVKGSEKFMLIVPGGGYFNVCSIAEGFPIAEECNKNGITAFVLHYRVGNYARFPNPQNDLAWALRFILNNRDYFSLSGNGYSVCGFSAGGHLAASFGIKERGYYFYNLPMPDAIILAYPVITMGDFTHLGSRREFLKEQENNPEIRKAWSVEQNITNDYPPTYIWNCENDNSVPPCNCGLIKSAMDAAGVKNAYEKFPGEDHGLGLGTGTAADGWLLRAINFWLNTKGGE